MPMADLLLHVPGKKNRLVKFFLRAKVCLSTKYVESYCRGLFLYKFLAYECTHFLSEYSIKYRDNVINRDCLLIETMNGKLRRYCSSKLTFWKLTKCLFVNRTSGIKMKKYSYEKYYWLNDTSDNANSQKNKRFLWLYLIILCLTSHSYGAITITNKQPLFIHWKLRNVRLSIQCPKNRWVARGIHDVGRKRAGKD